MSGTLTQFVKNKKDKTTPSQDQRLIWPVTLQRSRPRWFPARQRLIGLVRAASDDFVLPPAIVRKATWRD